MSYIGSPPQFAQFPSKFFDGDGSAMTVTLDYAPPNNAALLVFISGVRQDTSAYTLSGTSLTFTGTVPSGTDNVQVVHLGQLAEIPTPGDDTVSTAKIQDDAVTAAKLANSINTDIAANTAKVTNATHTGDVTGATALTIADNAVSLAKMAGLARGKIIYGDSSGDPAALAVGSADQVLTSDGTDVSWVAAASSGFNSVQAFTASGTWTRPTGITKVLMFVTGGGGGGGMGSTGNWPGSGGGAGTAIKFLDVSAISTSTITLGAGGAGAGSSGAGTVGGASSWADGTNTITGGGGGGGTGHAGVAAGGTGTNGDANITGGPGVIDSTTTAYRNTGGASFWGGGRTRASTASAYGSGGYGTTNESTTDGQGGFIFVLEYK